MSDFVYPDQVDEHFDWPAGRAQRLAKRGRLPYYVLPDGEIRFRIVELESLIRHVAAEEAHAGADVRG